MKEREKNGNGKNYLKAFLKELGKFVEEQKNVYLGPAKFVWVILPAVGRKSLGPLMAQNQYSICYLG